MKGLARLADSLSEKVAFILMRAAGLLIAVAGLIVGYGVIMRYVVRHPVAWTWEMPSLLYLCITALALAYVQIQRKHINVDFLLIRLPRKRQDALKVFSHLVFFIYCAILLAAMGIKLNNDWIVRTQVAKIYFAPFFVVLIIGLVVLMVRLLVDMGKEIGKDRH